MRTLSKVERVYKITNSRSEAELAEVLGVSQNSVSRELKKNSIPNSWLIVLLNKYNVNPEWILTGSGCVFLLECTPSIFTSPENINEIDLAKNVKDFILEFNAYMNKTTLLISRMDHLINEYEKHIQNISLK